MKLRLPHKFQTALMAALASVSITTLSSATAYAEETNAQTMHVYILTGQSNSLGAVKGEPLPTVIEDAYQSGVLLFNGNMHKDRPSGATTNRYILDPEWQTVAPQEPGLTINPGGYGNNPCMGPEYGFAYMMEKKGWAGLVGENDALAVVKSSLDGGGNGYWLQTNNAYKTVLDTVKLSITQAVDLGYSKISLDGLMYLQGESNSLAEANIARERFTDFLGNLNSDLDSWLETEGLKGTVTLSFSGEHASAVTGEPATWTANNIQDPTAKETVTANQFIDLATSNGKLNADQNGYGFVYTRDLAKITSGDNQNVHYNGVSQLTIGARYAYAFAVQNGINVGTVRGQDDSKNLDDAAAWWMEQLPAADAVAVWDLSSVSHSLAVPNCNNIATELTVGGIRIEDIYQPHATNLGQGTVAITGGSLKVGGSGIELQGGNLTVTTSNVATTAAQTWKVAAGKTLQIGSADALAAFGGNHAISIGAQTPGQAAGMVKLNAATDGGHSFSIDDGAGLVVNASDSVWSGTNVSIRKSGSFGTVTDGDVTINSLTLDAGAVFDLGGGSNVGLHTGSLSLGGDATFRMNVDSVTVHDCLYLTSVTAASPSTVTFELTAGAGVRSGVGYVLAQGWDSSKLFAVSASDKAELSVDDNNQLIATFSGIADYTKPWVQPTGDPLTIDSTTVVSSIYDAAKVHGHATEGSSSLTQGNTASGSVYFFASNTNGNNGQVYAELKDASATWVVAAGHNGGSGYRNNMGGSYHVKVTGTQAVTYGGVYAVTNGTVQGDAYIELCNDAATYNGNTYGDAVNGIYNGTVEGSVTLLVRSGIIKDDITGGHFSATAGQHIGKGVFVQVDGGSVSGQVRGGGLNANGTINGGTHVLVNGGTFAHNVMGGGSAGTINGGTEVIIRGGTIQGDVMGGGTGGTIADGAHVTITGGTINGNVYGGGTGGTITGGTGVTIEGNLATILGNISADTVTLQDISPNASGQQTVDKYHGTITANTVVLNKYNVERLLANLETKSLVLSGGTTTTIGNLTLTACDITVQEGSALTLENPVNLGYTTTYNGRVAIADGTLFNMQDAVMTGDISGYSEGTNGFAQGTLIVFQKADGALVEGTALYGTSGTELTPENTATFSGSGILTGATFKYDTASGQLTAEAKGFGGPYYVNEGTVAYRTGTSVYTADDIRLNGGTLQFQEALKDGTALSVTKTGSGIIVDNGVSMAVNRVDAASLAEFGVTLTGTMTASTRDELLANFSGTDANITTTASITLDNNDATHAGGVLTIGDSLSLNLNGAKGYTYDISSFKQVVLGDGSAINYNGTSATFKNVTLANGDASISITDMGAANNMLTLAGQTQLNGHKLSITVPTGDSWKRFVTIAQLVGDADSTLSFEGGKTSDSNGSKITINSLQGFGGTLELKENNTGNALTATVNTGSGSAVKLAGVNLAGTGEVLEFTAQTALNLGTVSVANDSEIKFKGTPVQNITIAKLAGDAAGKTLKVSSADQTVSAHHIVLGAADADYTSGLFNGTLWVTSQSGQGQSTRSTVDAYIAAQDVLRDTTLKLRNNASNYNNTRISLSLGTDVRVAGIEAADDGNNANLVNRGSYIRSGSLSVTQPDGIADFVSTSSQAYTLEITGSGTYTANSRILDKVNLHMNGSGTQTFTGNLSDMSKFDGSITVSQGTLVLTPSSTLATHAVNVGSNGTLTIAPQNNGVITAHTTIHNEGILNLTGTVKLDTVHMADFDIVEGSAAPVYSGVQRGDIRYENSGYLTTSAQYYLVKGTEGSTLTPSVDIDPTTGELVAQDTDAKSIIVKFKPNSTGGMFYVNDSFTYGTDMDAASDISIAREKTLTAAGSEALSSAKVLHGDGTYALASGASALNGNLTLGTDWTGTVRVSGVNNNGLQLGTVIQSLRQGNSWVELSDVAGKLDGNSSYAGNIILTDTADATAMRIIASSPNHNTHLTGDIKGEGTIERRIGNGNTLTFDGDLSGWTGAFYNGGKAGDFNAGWNVVNFTHGGEINADFINRAQSTACYLTLVYQADTTVKGDIYANPPSGKSTVINVTANANTTFMGTVNANTLTVAQGKTATMATDATITGITNNGTVAVTGGHSLQLNASANPSLGNVELDGSSLKLASMGGTRTYSVTSLKVSGDSHINHLEGGGSYYNGLLNITSLTSAEGQDAALSIGNAARHNAFFANIDGGSFNGALTVMGEAVNGTRRTAVQLNDENVAAGAVVKFDVLQGQAPRNVLGLGVGAENVNILGITTVNAPSGAYIYSGKRTNTSGYNSNFDSVDTTYRTLTIGGDGEYSTSATVRGYLNLVMNGEGTQTFSGDMSAFNGNITVNAGTLAITGSNGVSAAYIASDTSDGTLDVTGVLTLTGAEAGDMADFTGSLKVGGLHVENGFHAISGVDRLGSTIQVGDEGCLVLRAGTYNLSELEIVEDDLTVTPTGNGFMKTYGGTVQFVEGYYMKDANMTFTHGEHTTNALDDASGVVTFAEYDYTTYYLREAGKAESLANAINTGKGQMTTVEMHAGTTLTADTTTAVNTLTIDADTAGTAAQVAGGTANFTELTGEGEVDVANGATLNAANITVEEGKALTIGGEGTLGVTAINGAGSTTVNAAAVNGNLAISGSGTVVFGEGSDVSLTGLNISGDGTNVTFNEKVTVAGTVRPSIGFENPAATGATVTFRDGFNYTGTNGYALLVGNGNTVYLGGETTLANNRNTGMGGSGKIVLQEGASFTTGRVINTFKDNTNNGTLEVQAGASFTAGAGGDNYVTTIDNAGSVTFVNHATVVNLTNSGTMTLNGLTMAEGATFTNSGTFTLGGAINIDASVGIVNNGPMVVTCDSAQTLGSTISGTGSLTKDGAGTLTVSGNNTGYTGNISVVEGTLKVGHNNALGTLSGARTLTIQTGGTLDVNGKEGNAANNFVVELAGGTLANSAAGSLSYGTRHFVTSVNVTDDSTIQADYMFGLTAGSYNAINVVFTDGTTLEKKGAADFVVTKATITGNGTFKVSAGTLRFQHQTTSSANFIMNGGSVAVGQQAAANYTLSRDIAITTTADSSFSLPLNTNAYAITYNGNANLAVSGAISGTGSLVKDGAGTLTLSDASTYTGGTTISAGTLVANNASALGTGLISVTGGNLEVGSNVNLTLAQNQLISNTGGTVVLNNGSGITTWDSTYNHERQLGNVQVKGIATISTRDGAWNATTNIASLSGESITDGGSVTGPVLKLQTSAAVNYPTVYNLNGVGEFNGSIELSQLHSGERYLALNLNAVSGQNLALQLKGSTNATSHIGIGLGADATVRGISSDDGQIEATDDHVIFSGAANTTNKQKFNNDDSEVRTLTIETQAGDNFSTRARVQNNVNLVKKGEGTQALSVDTTTANHQFNGDIDVEAGVLNIMNATSLNVKDVTIGAGATMGVYTNGTATEANEGKVTIASSYTLSAGNLARLNSDLEMAHGSRLDVSKAQVGTTDINGLIMGSSVTIQGAVYEDGKLTSPGTYLVYTDDLGVQHDAMADVDGYLRNYFATSGNQYYVLFNDVEELYLNGATTPSGEIAFNGWDQPFTDANTLFSNVNQNTYAVVYSFNGTNVGTLAICMVPEPTTGTLSLLALCALAARRRRK